MEFFDHVIVGGGILGASIAYHLSEYSSKRILVIDRGQFASGSSSKAAGLILQCSSKHSNIPLAKKTVDIIPVLEKINGERIDFHQVGSLRVACTDSSVAELESLVAAASRWGVDVSYPSQKKIKGIAPWLETKKILKSVFFPTDGYIDPYLLTWQYIKAAKKNHVKFVSNVEATGISIHQGQIKGIQTSDGDITCTNLIVACGVWASLFSDQVDISIPMAPVRSHYWITGNEKEYKNSGAIVMLPDISTYFRPELGGLLLGVQEKNCIAFDARKLPKNLDSFAPTAGDEHLDTLQESYTAILQFYPDLEAVSITNYISGLSSYTPDGEIILGKIDTIKGFFVAAGDCGSGITLSGGIGSIMAELVVDGKSKTDISKFKPDRFGKIKIYEEKFLSECASARSAKSKGHSSLQNSY